MAGRVRYESRANDVKRGLSELERSALKEVAKMLRKKGKKAAPKDEGDLRKNIATWVRKKQEVLQFGVYNNNRAKRKNLRPPTYAHLIEFGGPNNKKQSFLRDTVLNNITEIRLIMGKYLKHIENENRMMGIIDENEEVSDR